MEQYTMQLGRRVYNERGVAAIEFAIVLPILLILLFGIIEWSILLYDKAMITNASREGARAGIVFNSGTNIDNDTIKQVVRDYAQANLITFGADGGLNIPDPTRIDLNGNGEFDAGDTLSVRVEYTYDFFILPNLRFLEGFDEIFTLTATTVMRFE
jgi:hypothetical protein